MYKYYISTIKKMSLCRMHWNTWEIGKLSSCIRPARQILNIIPVRAWSASFCGPITTMLWNFYLKNWFVYKYNTGTIRNISLYKMHWNTWEIGKLSTCIRPARQNLIILTVRAWSTSFCGSITTILWNFILKTNLCRNTILVPLEQSYWAKCTKIH